MANPALLWELPDTPLPCVALHQQKLLVLWQLVAYGNICLGVQMIRTHPASALKDGRWEHIYCPPSRDGTCLAPKCQVLGECCTLWMLPPAQNVLCFCFMRTVLCFATLQCHWGPLWLHGTGMFQIAVTTGVSWVCVYQGIWHFWMVIVSWLSSIN